MQSTTRLAPFHRDALDLAKTTGHKTLTVLARYYNEKPGEWARRLRQNAKVIAVIERRRAAAEAAELAAA